MIIIGGIVIALLIILLFFERLGKKTKKIEFLMLTQYKSLYIEQLLLEYDIPIYDTIDNTFMDGHGLGFYVLEKDLELAEEILFVHLNTLPMYADILPITEEKINGNTRLNKIKELKIPSGKINKTPSGIIRKVLG
jgi:hypothetical protein